MKTAMQELMHILDVNEKNFISIIDDKITIAYHNVIKKQVEHLLEKEKEQIIDAWGKGYSTGCVVGSNDYTNEDEEKDNGNYYYNQTYNQKQHIIDIMKDDEDDGLYNQNES
jgi:hypothetical protein